MGVKVLLVEGREIVRLGLRTMLEKIPKIESVAEASSEKFAMEIIRKRVPDLIIMDLDSPPKEGVTFILKVKKRYPKTKILIFTIQDYESSLIAYLEAGADGYVIKSSTVDELKRAIEKINTEGSYMKPDLVFNILTKYKESSELADASAFNITSREMDVLNLISAGMTNTQIANKLFASIRTIEARRKKLLDKTGTVNTATLIKFAVLNGLIK
jgi:DNA-binding NarL/FixJ family response regulator